MKLQQLEIEVGIAFGNLFAAFLEVVIKPLVIGMPDNLPDGPLMGCAVAVIQQNTNFLPKAKMGSGRAGVIGLTTGCLIGSAEVAPQSRIIKRTDRIWDTPIGDWRGNAIKGGGRKRESGDKCGSIAFEQLYAPFLHDHSP
jgi:hypothetical protein